jgi:hypothetical protein
MMTKKDWHRIRHHYLFNTRIYAGANHRIGTTRNLFEYGLFGYLHTRNKSTNYLTGSRCHMCCTSIKRSAIAVNSTSRRCSGSSNFGSCINTTFQRMVTKAGHKCESTAAQWTREDPQPSPLCICDLSNDRRIRLMPLTERWNTP